MSRRSGFTAQDAALAKSAGKGTPKAILDAFFPAKITAADLNIQPVSLVTFMALEKVGSPLADFGQSTKAIGAEDIATALVILTMPCATDADVEQLRAIAGDPETIASLAWQVASRIPAAELIALGPKMTQRIQEGFATALPTKAPGDSGTSPFPPSQPEAQPSAGL
jgi:hypothetical protein